MSDDGVTTCEGVGGDDVMVGDNGVTVSLDDRVVCVCVITSVKQNFSHTIRY